MKRTAVILFLVLTVLPLVAAPRAGGAHQEATRQAAPDFTVQPYPGGRSVSLSDLRGSVVLVYFFFPT